ncbi:MAG: HNH endonuclease [Gemmatimonadales bacterium]
MALVRRNGGKTRPLSQRQADRRMFCGMACRAAGRVSSRLVPCARCGAPTRKHRYLLGPNQLFCSRACSSKGRRMAPARHRGSVARPCQKCGVLFEQPERSRRRYCSRACRYAHGWEMPAEIRERFSRDRRRGGNPNWQGGRTAGLYRLHTAFAAWGRRNLPARCELCGSGGPLEMHHIASKRRFAFPVMAHFRQNLAVLCVPCHRRTDGRARRALRAGNAAAFPLGDRLPESILRQLVQDGSVSALDPVCDFAPLGNVSARIIRAEWYAKIDASPGDSRPSA